jgi:hypothetical protein
MKYACLVYFEQGALSHLSSEEARKLTEDCIAYNGVLDANGHLVIAQALELPSTAVTLRMRDGHVSSIEGPFATTHDILAGFVLVEAHDLNEAKRLAAGIPLAKIGCIEIRPVMHAERRLMGIRPFKPRPSELG